jgi:outer membrane lipoprotein-sorting protein
MNHSNHKQLLGGNLTVMQNGNVIYQGDITPNLRELESLLDLTNSSYSGSHTVTYGGTETVTVPLGTYTATKYMYKGDYNLTIFVDPKVPVPVKVEAVSTSGTIYDIDLMGWG